MQTLTIEQSIEQLLAAFGRHDKEAYFACFHPEATFLFYNSDETGLSKVRYQQLWESWEQEFGFRVLSCQSTNANLTMFGHTAVFTHEVTTKTEWAGEENVLSERESIIFSFDEERGQWLCIHEHLSSNEEAE